ncbi:MAG: Cell division protein FtsI [Peptidoglycan synthetase] (EC [uncultured Sulfurovum sp.]|uniref:Cell division protein FtsI [Peptidoglycan synthetase] (EC) n=1 Tax=uncultured Sulfurovum sp. TaxID=269237 RepID=A0A6S6SDD4_9BACT|nr:MAG: Cell division protein FtsI [Peptidoglycan synthetase] (EC [uncultured Sulfurovum sp.]
MRFSIILIIFVLFWLMLISRIYQISIKSNYYYENLAQMNIERKYFIKPVRGEILDRHGKLLAVNDIGFSIKIAPHLTKYDKILKKRVADTKLIKLIAGIVKEFPDLNQTKLITKYVKKDSSYNHRYIPVVDFIGYDGMIGAYPKLSINKSLKIESETKRMYPAGSLATHIVGYVGRSNLKENEKDPVVEKVGVIGKTGLEREYNNVLQGELGYRLVKVSARNKEVAELEKVDPKDDQNLVLNIDLGLQKRINELFVGQAGVAVVMGIDGDIIAGVSYPSYDPNLFVGGISTKDWKALITNLDHPFTNKIVGGAYPPGSTIKMGMALAFSKAGTAVESTEYCKGYITLGKSKHKFRCWSRYGHGQVGLRKAIRESCDVYFYNKALDTGINSMAKSLRKMGLGVKTGVDLPRERTGIVPDKPWKRKRFKQGWYRGETVISSIGQGYNLATPLQVAQYTAFLATERLPTPHFVDVIAGRKVEKKYETFEVNKQHLNTIRLGMYDVCNSQRGTARRTMSKLPIIVAGKTGTSQVVSIPQGEKKRMLESQLDYYSRSHAWLTTYAPYENPKYVVTVLVEHGGHGGSTAGPIAAEIYKWMANEGYFGDDFKGKIKLKDLTKKKKGDGHGH